MSRARILIFAKEPAAGRVKTRLIPTLGAAGAARLARDMLDQTLEAALATGLDVELCGDPDPAQWREPIPPVRFSAQGPGNLGERLARSAERTLAEGPVLLVGTDCPDLDRDRLEAAANSLEAHDAIIHPAVDGGYALLGLRRFDASLFAGIGWSGPSVARDTVARIVALGWSLHLAETLQDVDEPEDLARLSLDHGNPAGAAGPRFPLSRE